MKRKTHLDNNQTIIYNDMKQSIFEGRKKSHCWNYESKSLQNMVNGGHLFRTVGRDDILLVLTERNQDGICDFQTNITHYTPPCQVAHYS